MRQQEVIERLCALVTETADKAFAKDNLTHDCFCGSAMFPCSVVDVRIIEFIEQAVRDRINNT